jgi:predicted NBD/HSP70 family sugar kinase
MFGGIDLGGTKIEACLFDADMEAQASRRIATPRIYPELIEALASQYDWMRETAGVGQLPLGVGVPGHIDRETGFSLTSNLPATGRPLRADLSKRLGFAVSVGNDCKCFALSEANGGAGAGFETVFGLILGTGCGAGVCRNGRLVLGANGLPGEIGHIGVPARCVAVADLPMLRCGCGRIGCYETLVSGPGLTALARHRTGEAKPPTEIISGAARGDPAMQTVIETWLDLVSELLNLIQVTFDPDCIVLGGGLSRIQDLDTWIMARFPWSDATALRAPSVLIARYGDSSGVRGAAMLAKSSFVHTNGDVFPNPSSTDRKHK